MGDTISPAFADPGKYELWDCKKLETERKNLANRTEELQKLMDKAKTGVGGSVVAEMAYRNDYVAVRGQAHFADEAWNNNKCTESAPEVATLSAAPAPKASKPKANPKAAKAKAVGKPKAAAKPKTASKAASKRAPASDPGGAAQ